MGDIYSSAKRVIAWIGEGDDDSDLAMDVFRRILTVGENQNVATVQESGRTPIGLHIIKTRGNSDNRRNCIDISDMMAIIMWSSRSYWHRLWIVQELNLARNLTITVGERSISGEDSDKVFEAI